MEEFRVIIYCISHLFMMGFLLAFSQCRYSLKKTVVILIAAFGMLSGIEILRPLWMSSSRVSSIVLLLQVVIVQGTAILVSDFRDFRALFTGLSASNYVLPGVLGSVYIRKLTGWYLASYLYEILMCVGLLWILVHFLRPIYLEIQRENRGDWSPMCLMPMLFYVSAMGLDQVVRGSERLLEALMTIMFFLLSMYLAYYLVFKMVGKIYREQQAMKDRKILQAGIRALRREMEEMSETERRIAVHVHDRRHLIRIMQEIMLEKNYDGLNQMLERMEEMTEVRCPLRYTDNAPVNGVLVSYAAEAEKQKIPFSVQLDIPEKLRINEWQFAVAIGNLLDNAVLACARIPELRERHIQVTGCTVRAQVLVEIRNTCEEPVVFDSDTGLPVSGRGEEHGIGLHSVAYFARKNQLTFDCGVEQGEFYARILI